jgi:hypothetical protein
MSSADFPYSVEKARARTRSRCRKTSECVVDVVRHVKAAASTGVLIHTRIHIIPFTLKLDFDKIR